MATAKSTKPAPPKRGFTDAYLKNLQPTDKRYGLGDGSGLRVVVLTSGDVTFETFVRDRTTGKNRRVTFGRYGTGEGRITLAQARKKLAEVQAKHRDGESLATPAGAPKTVAELAELFYQRRIVPHRRRPDVVRAVLDNDILPAIGDRKLATLSTPTVASVVEQTVDRGAAGHAAKVLATCKQMFKFAEGRGYIDRSPAYALDRKDLGVIENTRDRYLNPEEIRALWGAIDAAPRMSVQLRAGLKILLLTGVRTGELLAARWEHIDFDAATWLIPKPKADNKGGTWTVPLVPAVRALFHELKEIADDLQSPWVMAGLVPGQPIDGKALGHAMRRLFQLKDGGGDPLLPIAHCCVHDLRRTLRSGLEELGVPWHICEKCLNHSLGRVERVYARSDLMDQRREALQKWADHVDLIVTDRANVVRIGGAA
jgi:integrase